MVLIVFLLAAAVQLFCWTMFSQYAFPKTEKRTTKEAKPHAPVSVIVCFHNEEAQIEACLARILEQAYLGEFEVIAVDDNSTDNSAAIVQKLTDKHKHQLRLLQPGPTRPGKKDALTFGINNARYEHILLTDADCLPKTTRWLALMTQPLRSGAEVVLGIGEYSDASPRVIDQFQRFEAIYVAIKYLSFARLGLPYMGVGRNLAYRKSFFLRSNGFASHTDLPGGDDDLLVGNNALGNATACVTSPQARTVSSLAGSWSVFFRQRMRHQSVGFRYRAVHQLSLGLVALSHGLFFLLGFLLLLSAWWKMALLVYALRFLLVFSAYQKSGLSGAVSIGRGRINAGAREVGSASPLPVWMLLFFDAMLAPWYLVLGGLGLLPTGRW